MSGPSSPETPAGDPQLANEIDLLCDEFEWELKEGRQPSVTEFLDRVEPDRRLRLTRELLALEIDYRRKRGDTPKPADYAGKYAIADKWIGDLLAEMPSVSAETGSSLPARQLLHGVLALSKGHIDLQQFAAACEAWPERTNVPLLDQLVERGWITEAGKQEIVDAAREALAASEGDAVRAMADVSDFSVREILRNLQDADVQATYLMLPATKDFVNVAPLDLPRQSRSRYSVTRLHGKGGIALVWLAYDRQLQREIALKSLRPETDSSEVSRRRFAREAQITGQLNHPNIIPVHEFALGEEDDRPFYTMRFLRGQTLTEVIAEYHQALDSGSHELLAFRDLLNNFVITCRAIAYAHSRGVVHRDLKPSNIMLGAFGEVIVLDWGLAQVVAAPADEDDLPLRVVADQDDVTEMGEVVGTPAFMAPEQADGRSDLIDARTDVYGLGGVLHSILTGKPPHAGSKTAEVIHRAATGPTPSPKDLDRRVPAALDAICTKALAKRRRDRYQTASELADDVARWLADEPVSVFPEPWNNRAARWLRRHRTWAQALAATLVIVACVSTIAALVVDRARRNEAAAKFETQRALDAEQLAKAEALRRLKEARDAVDKSLTGVSQVLSYFPGVQPLRTELLEEAAKDYERFAQEESDDVELRAESGRAFIRLGDVRQLLAQYVEARKNLLSAEAIFLDLTRQAPDNPDYELELANSRVRLGVLHTLVDPRERADEYFQQAIEQLQRLAGNEQIAGKFRLALGSALLNHAQMLLQERRGEDARRVLEEAESEFEQLAERQATAKHHEGLAAARHKIGQALWQLGQHQDAVEKLQRAAANYTDLVRSDPDDPGYLEGLAGCRVSLANALRELGREDEALEAYRMSATEYEDLLRIRPGIPHYRENVAIARTNLGQILQRQGRAREAKQHLLEALAEMIELAAVYPNIERYVNEHAACTATLAIVLRDLDANDLAKQAFDGAVEGYRRLTEEVSEVTDYHRRLAISLSGLGRLQHKLGETDDAEQTFLEAIAEFEEANRRDPDDPYTKDGLAWCRTHLGDLLFDANRLPEAKLQYSRVLALRKELTANIEHVHNFAWFLATCEDEQYLDLPRAVELADDVTKQAPGNGKYWTTLGLAHYYAGNWDEGLKALEFAKELRGEYDGFVWFVLAMVQWQRDEVEAAKTSFLRGVELMQHHRPGSIELRKVHAEAAALMDSPALAPKP